MKNFLYVFYNTLSNRYGDVVAFPSDGFALARVQPSIKPEQLEEVQLCRIGSIDILTGKVDAEPPVRIAWREEAEKMPVTEAK